MKVINDFVFFWDGIYSQWHKSNLVIDGVTYNCAEQYMMAMKAKHFNDEETLAKIMSIGSPRIQKEYGRQVKNFDPIEWTNVCKDYVFKANLVKFSDPILKKSLLNTGTKEIVEASPYDKIWGIGLDQDDPRALDKKQWQGTNWLGEVLMKVRETLR
jgi:ribA/ribD-fused uncharacterized protein